MTDKNHDTSGGAVTLASHLRRRSLSLRRYAAWILVIIVGVLLSGIGVFVAAGTLANRETTTAVDESRNVLSESLRARRAAAVAERRDLSERRDQYELLLSRELAGKGTSGRAGRGPVAERLRDRVNELDYRSRYLESQIADIDQRMPQLVIPAAKSIPAEAQFASLISAISTRIGAIVLLLFLVQILVPLYRYNMKLASHYESCADAIDLVLVSGVSAPLELFARLTSALSPAGVEFGTAPPVPMEQALRLMADILAKK